MQRHATRAARGPADRAARVRRRSRLLLRELEPSARSPTPGLDVDVRAGQPLALAPRRAARAALPDRARAGQARARGRRRGVRRRGRPAAQLARLRHVGRRRRCRPRTSACCGSRRDSRTASSSCRTTRSSSTRRPTTGIRSTSARCSGTIPRSASRGRSTAEPILAAKDAAGTPLASADDVRREPIADDAPRILVPAPRGQVGGELAQAAAGAWRGRSRSIARRSTSRNPTRSSRAMRDVDARSRRQRRRVHGGRSRRARARRSRSPSTRARRKSSRRKRSASGRVLIHYSTDYVFDGTRDRRPTTRTRRPAPLNVYGAEQARRRARDRGVRRARARAAHELGLRPDGQEFPADHPAPRRASATSCASSPTRRHAQLVAHAGGSHRAPGGAGPRLRSPSAPACITSARPARRPGMASPRRSSASARGRG